MPTIGSRPHNGPPVTFYEHHLSAGTRAEPAQAFWATTGYQELSPGLDVHIHEGMELGIVLEGAEEIRFGEQALSLGPGEVWLSPSWEPHGWRVTAHETLNVVVIFLPPFLGEEVLGGLSWMSLFSLPLEQRPRVVGEEVRTRVLAIARKLHWEIEHKPPSWGHVVRLELAHPLVELGRTRERTSSHPARATPLGPGHLDRVMPAIRIVHSDPSRAISVAEASAACGLSPSRFRHRFRETMGVSFGAFALRARLAFCAKCLLTTDLTVSAVAYQAGFTDASHLHHAFVNCYRRTPRQFREEGRLPQARPQPAVLLEAERA